MFVIFQDISSALMASAAAAAATQRLRQGTWAHFHRISSTEVFISSVRFMRRAEGIKGKGNDLHPFRKPELGLRRTGAAASAPLYRLIGNKSWLEEKRRFFPLHKSAEIHQKRPPSEAADGGPSSVHLNAPRTEAAPLWDTGPSCSSAVYQAETWEQQQG